MAFQLLDDLKDMEQDQEQQSKPRSTREGSESNFALLLGRPHARAKAQEHLLHARDLALHLKLESPTMRAIFDSLTHRAHERD